MWRQKLYDYKGDARGAVDLGTIKSYFSEDADSNAKWVLEVFKNDNYLTNNYEVSDNSIHMTSKLQPFTYIK